MRRPRSAAPMVATTATFALITSALLLPGIAQAEGPTTGPSTLPATTLVAAPPNGTNGPDDITRLSVGAEGKVLLWTAFQNGINPDGSPGTPGGPTQSTVAGFDPSTGAVVRTIAVTGKVDGLTADSPRHRLIATVNEDSNSALDVIDPATSSVTTFHYSPDPEVGGNGGTDSIAVKGGHIYVAHSNPSDTSQPTEYEATLDATTHTADLRAVFLDDSTASDAVTGQPVTVALTDPDTNFVMPKNAPRFGGQLATIGQADGQVVFASHLQANPRLTALTLTDNVAGNVPPADGLAVATSDHGTLYVIDAKAGTVQALDTSGWPAGTVFIGEPSDNGNPIVGTLDLSTGHITPLGNTFMSPKGLLFVPSGEDHNHGGDHNSQGD